MIIIDHREADRLEIFHLKKEVENLKSRLRSLKEYLEENAEVTDSPGTLQTLRIMINIATVGE